MLTETAETVENGGAKGGLTIDGTTQTILPPPPKIDLATPLDVRREMAKVYRDAKAGKIDTQDGSRLIYMLSQVGKMIELHEVETRLAALEAKSGNRLSAPN